MKTTPLIYLAPIQGVTNDFYRNVFHRLFAGVDCYYSPFVRVQKDGTRRNGISHYLPPFNPAAPLVPQILSNDADEFLVFDRQLQQLGYPEMNWNLGCPVRMVTLKRRGSGLLPHADHIQSILEGIIPQMHCRLSIKLRLGLNDSDEILSLIPILNRFPIKELIIHPRIGMQMYKGQADLGKFSECLRLTTLRVVYNGDIFNAATFNALQKQFPQIDGWMLGRGILANPFLPAQIKGFEQGGNKSDRIQRFHDTYAQQLATALCGPHISWTNSKSSGLTRISYLTKAPIFFINCARPIATTCTAHWSISSF